MWDHPISVLFGNMPASLILPVVVFALCLVFRYFNLNDALAIVPKSEEDEICFSTKQRVLWPVAGFVAVLTALLLLEQSHPYYFTQDDNLAVNLPAILQGCRSLFSGVFPTWNPHQYMGSPSTSLGYYALTYPFTYVSYWLSRTVLHNENATLARC